MSKMDETVEKIEAEAENTTPQDLKNVENLTNELKRLLVKHEAILNDQNIRGEVETLERWMESYRRGLAAANKISTKGASWLADVRDHLKLAADEVHRLESEGGNPLSTQQAEKNEDLLRAIQRLNKVIPSFEHMFAEEKVEEPA